MCTNLPEIQMNILTFHFMLFHFCKILGEGDTWVFPSPPAGSHAVVGASHSDTSAIKSAFTTAAKTSIGSRAAKRQLAAKV
jgi:hypothetical protein